MERGAEKGSVRESRNHLDLVPSINKLAYPNADCGLRLPAVGRDFGI